MADGGGGSGAVDMDIDFGLPKAASGVTAASPSKNRFRPKPKSASSTSAAAVKSPVKKAHSSQPLSAAVKPEAREISVSSLLDPVNAAADDLVAPKLTAETGVEFNGREDAVEEDDVPIREFNMYCTGVRREGDALLYVMQYPLRPAWRPYELSGNCSAVRVKPKRARVEIDFSVGSGNHDEDGVGDPAVKERKLVSTRVPCATNYAVGMVVGDSTHLHPVDAVVQMRPSFNHLDGKKISSTGKNEKMKVEKPGETSKEPDEEDWIPLEYIEVQDPLTSKYCQVMMSGEDKTVAAKASLPDYVSSLCPPPPSDKKNNRLGPSVAELLALPFEQRLKTWLKFHPVSNFSALKYLAQNCSEEDLFRVLKEYAYLVRGLWVCKSSFLLEGIKAHCRDAVLLHFTTKGTISEAEMKGFDFPQGIWSDDSLMDVIYVRRRFFKDLKFKEDRDSSFEKRYPHIVEEQKQGWQARESMIFENLRKLGADSSKQMPSKRTKKGESSSKGMSEDTRKHLSHSLLKIFENKKVRNMHSIIQDLRKEALSQSSHPKPNKAMVDAIEETCRKPQELESVVCDIAARVHGVYAIKTSEALSLRNVVITQFREAKPKSRIKKDDILEAGKTVLKREITDAEFKQTIDDLCDSASDGSVTFKTGD